MPEDRRGKKKRARKRRTRRSGLTRVGLAQQLGVGLTTVDRLIAYGLKPIGRRGPAKLYSLAAARRIAAAHVPAEDVAADVLIGDYRTHAEDLADRRHQLEREWVRDAAWLPHWRRFVVRVSRITASWPARLAERIGQCEPADAARLHAADGPRFPPPPPCQYFSPDALCRLLAGDPAAHPWKPAATPGITRLAARGSGIAPREDGSWWEWRADQVIGIPPTLPPPIFRPLFEETVDAVTRAARGLARVLEAPKPDRLPPAPRTVDAARCQWRTARARYRQQRVLIRRGHHRRAEIVDAIEAAIDLFRARWWAARGRLTDQAGDGAAVLKAANRLRAETLADFATLGGLFPRAPSRSSTRRTS